MDVTFIVMMEKYLLNGALVVPEEQRSNHSDIITLDGMNITVAGPDERVGRHNSQDVCQDSLRRQDDIGRAAGERQAD